MSLAKKKKLPFAVLEILEQLGIVPEKATYVCEIITEEHKVLYQFSYRIVGNILKEREDTKNLGRGEAYCGHEPYPYGAPGFPTPHFDLEFWMRLPNFNATLRLIFFSLPRLPMAPGSRPPCPGSMTTVYKPSSA